jgi:hypothetical protein
VVPLAWFILDESDVEPDLDLRAASSHQVDVFVMLSDRLRTFVASSEGVAWQRNPTGLGLEA